MTKLYKNKILNILVLGLFALLILGLGFIAFIPMKSEAHYIPVYDAAGGSNYFYTSGNTSVRDTTPVVYVGNENTQSNSGQVLGASTVKKTTVAKKTTTVKKAAPQSVNDLAASTILGTGGFMPTGLLGWLLLAILILIIVIIARKFFGLEDKYHATPLKHS